MSDLAATPIIVFGDDWGRHVSSMQHVFRPILEKRPVVWVNGIGHRVPGLRGGDLQRAWEKARATLPRMQPSPPVAAEAGPLAVLQPRVLPWHHVAAVHALNTWSLVRAIKHALARHGLNRRPVLVTGSPPSVGVVGRLDERAAVYFCMDDFLHLAGVTPWMLAPFEQRLLDQVDAVVATAESLTRSKRPRSGRTHYLPQGVNYEHFAAARPIPADLAAIPAPRIGFAGGVSACCDFLLIRELARALPHVSVVLVGPVSVDLAGLVLKNLHVLGPRPYSDLPAYVQHFDVGLIPYLLNEWTRAVDPLKLLEYLAAGLPVVSTDIPEVRKYREAVAIAGTRDRFVREVAAALRVDRDEVRRRGKALARKHTWAVRADELLALLDELSERRPVPAVAGVIRA